MIFKRRENSKQTLKQVIESIDTFISQMKIGSRTIEVDLTSPRDNERVDNFAEFQIL